MGEGRRVSVEERVEAWEGRTMNFEPGIKRYKTY